MLQRYFSPPQPSLSPTRATLDPLALHSSFHKTLTFIVRSHDPSEPGTKNRGVEALLSTNTRPHKTSCKDGQHSTDAGLINSREKRYIQVFPVVSCPAVSCSPRSLCWPEERRLVVPIMLLPVKNF